MKKPALIRRFACLMLLSAVSALARESLGDEPKGAVRRPNVVLIFADDLGWQDTGFSGSDFYETPHLDRLAREGMTFTQAYASAGNCAPSRACLLSGQYTPRHHVYAVGSTNRGPTTLMRMKPVPNKSGLPPGDLTMARAMQQAGYATGMFGKWHLDGPDGASPAEQGFDVVKVAAHSRSGKGDGDPKGIFAITTAACEFIEANRSRPFFAYIPHYAVHSALEARPETLAKFKAKPPGKLHGDPLYAACIAELDTGVGLLLKKLADLGLDQNTLVLFTSDNGGTAGSQEPLRGKKGSYFEGGIREPMLVRWPGVVKPATKCDVPVISVDFYPTFLAAAGSKLPAGRALDGTSLLPLLEGATSLDRGAIFWHFPGYLDGPVPRGRDPVFRTRPVSVIRKGDWKLFLYHEEWQLDRDREKAGSPNAGGKDAAPRPGAVELYNVADDPGELTDVALQKTSQREELLADLLAWQGRVKALLPTEPNPDYDPSSKGAAKGKGKGQGQGKGKGPGKGKNPDQKKS